MNISSALHTFFCENILHQCTWKQMSASLFLLRMRHIVPSRNDTCCDQCIFLSQVFSPCKAFTYFIRFKYVHEGSDCCSGRSCVSGAAHTLPVGSSNLTCSFGHSVSINCLVCFILDSLCKVLFSPTSTHLYHPMKWHWFTSLFTYNKKWQFQVNFLVPL